MEITHATATDAQLVLHLYDLRRETEMRKARNWFAGEFWPRNFSEIEQIMMQFESPQNHWFRQILSYWDLGASLVVHGALHPGLFHDSCPEAWFCYAKLKPFLQEGRTKFSPDFLANLEKVIEGSAEGRERLQRIQDNLARFRTMAEANQKQHQTGVSEAA